MLALSHVTDLKYRDAKAGTRGLEETGLRERFPHTGAFRKHLALSLESLSLKRQILLYLYKENVGCTEELS